MATRNFAVDLHMQQAQSILYLVLPPLISNSFRAFNHRPFTLCIFIVTHLNRCLIKIFVCVCVYLFVLQSSPLLSLERKDFQTIFSPSTQNLRPPLQSHTVRLLYYFKSWLHCDCTQEQHQYCMCLYYSSTVVQLLSLLLLWAATITKAATIIIAITAKSTDTLLLLLLFCNYYCYVYTHSYIAIIC